MRISLDKLTDIASSQWDSAKNAITSELQKLQSTINTIWDIEHNADGTHGDVTVETLDLQGASAGVLVDLPYDANRFQGDGTGTWGVSAGDFQYLRYSRIGQVVWIEFCVNTSTIASSPEYLVIRLPEFAPFFDRNTETLSATQGTVHTGGHWVSQDNIAPFGVDSGPCSVVTTNVGGQSAAELHLTPLPAGAFSNTVSMYVCGSTTFPVNKNNVRNAFPA